MPQPKLTTELESFTGRLIKTIYSKGDGFFVGLAQGVDNCHEIRKVVGEIFSPMLGSIYKFEGWMQAPSNPKYREPEFKFKSCERALENDTVGIEIFLQENVDGIGWRLAHSMVEAFGKDALNILANEPEKMVGKVAGVSFDRLKYFSEQAAKHLQDHGFEVNLMGLFDGTSINRRQKAGIIEKWGRQAFDVIKENPYVLTTIHGIGFKTADSVAMKVGYDKNGRPRVEAGIMYAMKESENNDGHTCLGFEELIGVSEKLLGVAEELIECRVLEMIDDGRLVQYFDDGGKKWVYRLFMYTIEDKLAKLLHGLNYAHEVNLYDEKCLDGLDDEQVCAVDMVRLRNLSIITGSPGTGKSYTIWRIIKGFSEERILLAAPTGKAAKRIEELSGMPASTIHRLLGATFSYVTGRFEFQYNEYNQLDCDLLIIDESSMLDVQLAYHLLSAVRTSTRVLFVGDRYQLPPVGAGFLFADMLRSAKIPFTELRQIKRQAEGSDIFKFCHKIRDGWRPKIDNGNSVDLFIFQCSGEETISKTLQDVVMKRIPSKFGAAPSEIQLITPVRSRTDLSVDKLNQVFRPLINQAGEKIGNSKWHIGDRIINKQNDYENDVMNGDTGCIIGYDYESKSLIVRFDCPQRIVNLSIVDNSLQHAYAITCHSAQGSEYPYVVIPAFSGFPNPLKSKKWIYTAVSRAKKLCVIVGEDKFIEDCHKINWDDRRNTNLCGMIKSVSERVNKVEEEW
jgi:exodeoxyribonuclease V alpha subunit